MGQKPVPPMNIPIPTKVGPKMGGEFTYPKMGSQNGFEPRYLKHHNFEKPMAWDLRHASTRQEGVSKTKRGDKDPDRPKKPAGGAYGSLAQWVPGCVERRRARGTCIDWGNQSQELDFILAREAGCDDRVDLLQGVAGHETHWETSSCLTQHRRLNRYIPGRAKCADR